MSALAYAIAALFGLVIGSFLNVVIHRGPGLWGLVDDPARRGGLARPRSYCPACGAPLKAWRLAPLVSFALQRGRCASCGAPISWRYPLVEAAGGAAAVVAIALWGPTGQGLLAALFLWTLIALAVIDLETGYLPDALTLPLLAAGLAANALAPIAETGLAGAAIGAAAGYGALFLIAAGYRRWRGFEGLGLGDAKLLGAIGAWLGWTALPGVILIGSLGTLAVLAIARLGGAALTARMAAPFGPGLAVGGAAMLVMAALR